jgi:hypothetical protein
VARIGRTFVVLAAVCLVTGRLHSAPSGLPPIPPLPADGWPLPATAEPFVRELISHVPPAQLESIVAANPDVLASVFRNLGTALVSRDAALQETVKRYATELVRVHAQKIRPEFSADDVRLLLVFQVIDPLRYGEDDAFRQVVDSILPRSLSPTLPEKLRLAAINELNREAPVSFDTAEALATSAGVVKRPSRERFVDLNSVHAKITTGGTEPIEASIYSINSRFADPAEAKRFLTAVRAAAPGRQIVVISDDAMRSALTADLQRLHIDFADSFSRPLTLWPRDPFAVARTSDGNVVFVNRPNLQPGREEDASMVRVLLDALPRSLDERWKPRWATGGTSFHNGQVLLTPSTAWISIHSVEVRARQLLSLDHVPSEEFGSLAGIGRYAGAVRRATTELSALYGRPVRFVHDLPDKQPLAAQAELMAILGGGAGFDLDSIITLLPKAGHSGGDPVALVGDLTLGARLTSGASAEDLRRLEQTYGLGSGAREAIVRFQSSPAAAGLQRFLDRCARDLAAGGVKVQRLPLIMVPSSAIEQRQGRPETPYFLVTWNNVVLERRDHLRAEGFASGLPAGDRLARTTFQGAGYELALFPPLTRSIILNGGYRCASNEVRSAK